MKNEIIFENVKFWLDQHIIHCSFTNKFDERFLEFDIEDLFIEVISTLTNGHYKPILIDLTTLSHINAFSVYKFISRNPQIKANVISKSFLVNSFNTKLLFKLYNIGNDGIVPIKVSTSFSSAVRYSNEKYSEFNAI